MEEEEVYNGPISPVDSPLPSDSAVGKPSTAQEQPVQDQTEEDEEESARILAEFKVGLETFTM